MYLRTTQRTNRDGSTVTYYALAHNERDPRSGQTVAKVIHSFGRADQIDRDDLVRLCRSIARICGVQVHDPMGEGDQATLPTHSRLDLPPDLQLVRTVELGPLLVIEHLWEELGIGPKLRQIQKEEGAEVPYERALLAMTANRLCDPDSKLGVWDRWLRKVYLPSADALELHQMYEALDLLYRHHQEVERKVFFTTAHLFNLTVDLVFYDTTTASFAIDGQDVADDEESAKRHGKSEALRRRGHSKEGTWSPQVVIALAVTREGLPVRSWVLPGNTADVTTVARVKADLRQWKLGRCLFVADAGMDSLENREALAKEAGTYLLAVRASSLTEVKQEVLSRAGRYHKISDNLEVKEVEVEAVTNPVEVGSVTNPEDKRNSSEGSKGRRYFVCRNLREAERQRRHREEVLREIRAKLERHKDADATTRWAAQLRTSQRTGPYLSVTPAGKLAIDAAKVRQRERLEGKWVLITNDETLGSGEAAVGYKALMVIEQCFARMKSVQIELTPVYHWRPRRIEAHVKVCVLALLLQRVAELRTGRPWSSLREDLWGLQVTEFRARSHRFFRTNTMPAAVAAVLKTLKISPPKQVLRVD